MKLISNDGQEFEIDEDTAKQSTLLKQFSDDGVDGPVPLPNVKGSILEAAANYLHIKTLLSVGCKAVANMVHGKSSAGVREMFNITYLPPGESANNSTTKDDAGELAETAVSNDTAATTFETDSTNK